MASSAATIQQNLNLIIPTASTLPPSLIDLATNLLAQTRAKAPTLKPDEEIARPFACCHIACERLKNRLALEIGKVGPPCGPRIYKKLYAFLDSSLVVEPSTPRARRVQDVGAAAGTATPGSGRGGRAVGSAAAPGSATTTRATPGSLGKRSRAAAQQVSNVPRFTMPLIRHVCEAHGTPRAATHVYAGVESVYRSMQTAQELLEVSAPGTPSKRRRSNNGQAEEIAPAALPVPTDDQVPALIAVVYLMTTSPMRGEEGFAVDDEQKRVAQSAVETYFAKHKTATATIDPTSLQRDIETYTQAATSGWSDMEWYRNLPASNETTDQAQGDEDHGPVTPRKQPAKTPLRRKEKHSQRKIGDEDVYGPAGLLPGLGTMFQPAVDWLSEDRREDFAAWKQDVLSSVEAIEQKA
jgi:origin recognition complex subunit 6